MIFLGGEVNRYARARPDPVEPSQRRLEARSEQGEAMDLCDDEVRRNEPDPPFDRGAKQPIGFGVILVAPAAQRDPRAAINEQSSEGAFGRLCAVVGCACGTWRSVRQ
ncbi:MAG TPA: hypothetical protein VE907_08630 [Gammaproteobacteria bacterium]|nr:hypothetical protein [Gammaproteobacteria bacterium]